MFAKKILISLALVAAIPLALSRHLRRFGWENRDAMDGRFPPANIEDLHFSESDVIPAVENLVEHREDDTENTNNKFHPMDVYPDIVENDDSENNANNQDNDFNIDLHEVIVPEKKWNARDPIVIMVNPDDDEAQNLPEYNENTENKNEEVQNWDNDEDSNDIPQVPVRGSW